MRIGTYEFAKKKIPASAGPAAGPSKTTTADQQQPRKRGRKPKIRMEPKKMNISSSECQSLEKDTACKRILEGMTLMEISPAKRMRSSLATNSYSLGSTSNSTRSSSVVILEEDAIAKENVSPQFDKSESSMLHRPTDEFPAAAKQFIAMESHFGNIMRYELLWRAKPAELEHFCEQHGLVLGAKCFDNSSLLRIRCRQKGCPFKAIFVESNLAIYGLEGYAHNHSILREINELEKRDENGMENDDVEIIEEEVILLHGPEMWKINNLKKPQQYAGNKHKKDGHLLISNKMPCSSAAASIVERKNCSKRKLDFGGDKGKDAAKNATTNYLKKQMKIGEGKNKEGEEDKEMEIDEQNNGENVTKQPPPPIYTDLEGNEWKLLAPSPYLAGHYPLCGMQKYPKIRQSTVTSFHCAHRFTDQKCPHLWLLLEEKQLIYQRFEHSHQVDVTPFDLLKGKTPSPRKTGPDADLATKMDYSGWKCIINPQQQQEFMTNQEEELANIIKEEGMKKLGEDEKIRKYGCCVRQCSYKMRWLKRRGELWSMGEHNRHPPALMAGKPKKRRKIGKY